MANYPLLRQGDLLPTVAVLQKLLNAAGATLRVDGEYGPQNYCEGPVDGVGLKTEAHIEQFAPVRQYLGPFAIIEMHGCRLAAGALGRRFLKRCATRLGVPVSASRDKQKMGSAFELTGAVVTMYPDDGGIESWAASLPDFPAMSVQ